MNRSGFLFFQSPQDDRPRPVFWRGEAILLINALDDMYLEAVLWDVLMVAYMNAQALDKTLETGQAHY